MTAQHTPGPWHAVPISANEWRINFFYNNRSGNIAVVDGVRGKENDANANLIAAAPDLLEALREIESITNYGGVISAEEETMYRARAAIAKARGE